MRFSAFYNDSPSNLKYESRQSTGKVNHKASDKLPIIVIKTVLRIIGEQPLILMLRAYCFIRVFPTWSQVVNQRLTNGNAHSDRQQHVKVHEKLLLKRFAQQKKITHSDNPNEIYQGCSNLRPASTKLCVDLDGRMISSSPIVTDLHSSRLTQTLSA